MKFLRPGVIALIILLMMSSCVGLRYLKKDQYLIYQQKVKGNKHISTDDLTGLFKIKRNKRLPIIPISPYVYFYQWGLKNYNLKTLQSKRDSTEKYYDTLIAVDSTNQKRVSKLTRKRNKKVEKIDKSIQDGNFLMRLGEPPAIYDSTQIEATREQMKAFLFNKGYFHSRVKINTEKRDRLCFITYIITEGPPKVIDSIVYQVHNRVMDSLLEATRKNAYIQKGENYDQDKLVSEQQRIEQLFQDNGFYDFTRQYITCTVDTTLLGDDRIALAFEIQKPERASDYKIFRIDSVIFTTDVTNTLANYKRYSESYNGITYRFMTNAYSKRILDRRVFIYPGQLYSRNNTIETQRQLLNLDNFKFVNINYDTTGEKFIANIFTSPLTKYQETNEIGLEVTQGFPGPFYDLSLKVRNVFGGLENLEISGRVGYEGVASAANPTKIYSSTEAGGQFNLIFPQFILPISNHAKSRLGQFNPKTNITSGYSYTNRPEYKRSDLNAHIYYTWQNGLKKLYNASLEDISLIKSSLDPAFQHELDTLRDEGNNLWRTFKPSLVLSSNFSITNNYNYNQFSVSRPKSGAFWRNYIETGGTMLNFFKINYLDSSGLELYKYIKFSTDYRKYTSLTPSTQFAFRANLGIAKSYAPNGVLPYERYFFAGGSNSIRAWRPRRLGPGSFFPQDDNGAYTDKYEQPGELLIQTSAEIRTKIVKFIQGAAFVDAGNIWMLEKDANRPGAEFDINRFYKEIAVGAGLGLRFDFTFLLLRFDLGFKVYNPALPPEIRFIGNQLKANLTAIQEKYGYSDLSKLNSLNYLSVLNLAIGYPF